MWQQHNKLKKHIFKASEKQNKNWKNEDNEHKKKRTIQESIQTHTHTLDYIKSDSWHAVRVEQYKI